MSKFDDQSDDSEVICPYCEGKYQPDVERYDEDEREEECQHCDKKYWVSQSFSVTHRTRPDCLLNGQQHNFETWTSSTTLGRRAEFCSECGECRLPPTTSGQTP